MSRASMLGRGALVALITVALTACGGGGGGGGGGDDGNPAPPTSFTETIVAADGGMVKATSGPIDGAVIIIPAGALAADTDIRIEPGTDVTTTEFFLAGPAVLASPAGTSFSSPATIGVPVDPSRIPTGKGLADVVVLRRDSAGKVSVLAPLAGGQPNEAETSSFSTFQAGVRVYEAQYDVAGDWFFATSGSLEPGIPDPADYPSIFEGTFTQDVRTDPPVTLTVDEDGTDIVFSGAVDGPVYRLDATISEDNGGTSEVNVELHLLSDMLGQGVVTSVEFDKDGKRIGEESEELVALRSADPLFDIDGTTWNVQFAEFGQVPETVEATVVQNADLTVTITIQDDPDPFDGRVSGATYLATRTVLDSGVVRTEVMWFELADDSNGNGEFRYNWRDDSDTDGGAGTLTLAIKGT